MSKDDLLEGLTPTQKRFMESDARFPLYCGGYGSGKTYVSAVKAIMHATVHNPGMTGIIVSPTRRQLYDDYVPSLLKRMTSCEIEFELEQGPRVPHLPRFTSMFLPEHNSRILFRNADDPERLKGPHVAWAGIEEVARVHEDIWCVLVSRARSSNARMNQTFATGTPEGLNWVYDKWVKYCSDGYKIFTASTADNPAVGKDYLEALAASSSEEEIEQKLHGHFTDTRKRKK